MYTKQVERVDAPNTTEKPVEFTHFQDGEKGWHESTMQPDEFERVIYLGKCKQDGDMFATYMTGHIYIFKGHLNSGKY